MLELTTDQNNLLYDATTLFHQWYKIHWGEGSPSYGVLLELNHNKITDISEMGELSESQITQALYDMIKDYEGYLRNEVGDQF
jgi:hypothetical protein